MNLVSKTFLRAWVSASMGMWLVVSAQAETMTLDRQVQAMDPKDSTRTLGSFLAGSKLEAGTPNEQGWVLVTYQPENGQPIQALCRAEDIGLKKPTENVSATSKKVSVSSSWYKGASGFKRATEEQAKQPIAIVVFVDQSSCGNCERVAQFAASDSKMKKALADVLKVRLDSVGSNADKEWIEKFKLNAGYFYLINSSGQVVPGAVWPFLGDHYEIDPELNVKVSAFIKKGS